MSNVKEYWHLSLISFSLSISARDPNADAEYVTQSPPVDYFKDFSGVVDTGVDTRVNPFEGSEVGPDGFFNNISGELSTAYFGVHSIIRLVCLLYFVYMKMIFSS